MVAASGLVGCVTKPGIGQRSGCVSRAARRRFLLGALAARRLCVGIGLDDLVTP